jgi:glycine betaine transporter
VYKRGKITKKLKNREEKKIGFVFYGSAAVILAVVMWGILDKDSFTTVSNVLFVYLLTGFGWLYMLAVFSFFVFSLYFAFSDYGKIRLGKDDEKPAYSNKSWYAMLISAGMGIGLVFFGVAEPLTHFLNPPDILIKPGSTSAVLPALTTSYFHWAFEPWACYCVIGLALGYFQFRKGYPALLSSLFRPLLGDKIDGITGSLIDVLTVFATATGIATSLGLGAMQISGGLNFLFKTPMSPGTEIVIIILITFIYTVTALAGLDKGIKVIANINILLCIILVSLVLMIGPTGKILSMMVSGIGSYLNNFIGISLDTRTYTNPEWMGKWTFFYWAWFIAWAPFVGIFIARISKGRTIKEFVLGVVFVPSIVTFIWFAVFGISGINLYFQGRVDLIHQAVENTSSAFFIVFSQYPFSILISIIAILVICTFFITCGSTATFVLGMLSSKGNLNPQKRIKVVWAVLQSGLAIVLLLTGGLAALQKASIAVAFPFIIIMILVCISLYKELSRERLN